MAGQSVPDARSRFRAVHFDSISGAITPEDVANTRSLHFADHRLRDDLLRSG